MWSALVREILERTIAFRGYVPSASYLLSDDRVGYSGNPAARRGGTGYISRDDARDDAVLEGAFQQTRTHHEGGRRLDAVMRDHQTNMAAVYAAYDYEMSAAWRQSS